MTISWFRKAASVAALVAISCSACAQQADFNEVGKQMSIMLQNSHFAKLTFDAELSRRFLSDYLKDLLTLRKALQTSGFDLVEREEETEMFVVTEVR